MSFSKVGASPCVPPPQPNKMERQWCPFPPAKKSFSSSSSRFEVFDNFISHRMFRTLIGWVLAPRLRGRSVENSPQYCPRNNVKLDPFTIGRWDLTLKGFGTLWKKLVYNKDENVFVESIQANQKKEFILMVVL